MFVLQQTLAANSKIGLFDSCPIFNVQAGNANLLMMPPSSPKTLLSFPSSSKSSQWYFTKSEIMQTPSIKQGLNPATEKANRSKGCQFIETVGQKLRLHQVTISTATTFLHRFYMRQPMSRYHHYVLFSTDLDSFPGCRSNMYIPCYKGRRESSETTRLDYSGNTIQST